MLFYYYFFFAVGSDYYQTYKIREAEREREKQREQEAAKVRVQYPRITDWNSHPLFNFATSFLVNKIDRAIVQAKKIPVGRDTGHIVLHVGVGVDRVYFSGLNNEDTFYFSSQGYDRIKVGYYPKETEDACKEFALSLSKYLQRHYASEKMRVSDDIWDEFDSVYKAAMFHIYLTDLQPQLKQV